MSSSGGVSKTVPGRGALSVTTSDTVDLAVESRALWCGGAGNLKVDMSDGTTVTFVGVVAGSLLPIQVTRVYATGTTATDIIAVY